MKFKRTRTTDAKGTGMKSARRAGWGCLGWGLAFIPFAAAFYWMRELFPFVVLFWVCIVIVAVCVFYGVWGLWVGYNPNAWKRHAIAHQEATKAGAIRECKRLGLDPPSFLF